MLSYQSVLHFYYRLDLGQDTVIVASSLNENGNEKNSTVRLFGRVWVEWDVER